MNIRYLLCLLLLCISPAYALVYKAKITGVPNSALKREMMNSSLIISSPDKQVATLNVLRLRVKNDIERIKNTAVFFGYYNCSVEPIISESATPNIEFAVSLGDPFTLGTLTLLWSDQDIAEQDARSRGRLDQLKGPSPEDMSSFEKGERALGSSILALDKELTRALRCRGFAFCKLIAKKIQADRQTNQVNIGLEVQTGPLVRFGSTHILGNTKVNKQVFKAYQTWKEGERYTPEQLENTETALIKSGLFDTVQIEESDQIEKNWSVPIIFRVSDAKPRTVGAGISYMTTYGAGVSAQWEHRNINGLGRKLSAQTALWQKQRSATLSYTIPHFKSKKQDLLWILEYDAQNYLPFTSSAVQASALLNRRLHRTTSILFGPSVERLESKKILSHQLYHLFKFPVQIRWSCANSPLDPTHGMALNVRLTPTWQYIDPRFSYLIHSSALSLYHSFAKESITLAARFGFSNIVGADKNTIPLPDRLFGGSENALRGYKTGSVSHLNEEAKPLGGRSMLTGSFEVRLRSEEKMGWVAFYDVGNVYSAQIPPLDQLSLLHSCGLGARYTTPIGPIRLDIAFPLQRRKGIDPIFQIYFSIGQAF